MSRSTDPETAEDAVARIRDYHRRTKHLPERFAPGPGYLDWANQPDPFRRFAGAPVVRLPVVMDDGTPPYDSLFAPGGIAPRRLAAHSLGLFMELSLGITAWKEYGGTRWALRANPSSGNLHPTEGYVVLPAVHGLSDSAGVFHYAPHEHALERRCTLDQTAWNLPAGATFLVGFSSVHWREAWKYGARAYRYCQHDAGHALGTLSFAGAALGWRVVLMSAVADGDIAGLFGLDRTDDFTDAEAEHPDLIAAVITDRDADFPRTLPEGLVDAVRAAQWTGRANRLSPDHVDWPEIGAAEAATVKPPTPPRPPGDAAAVAGSPLSMHRPERAAAIIRRRRSALDMDGQTGLSRDVFFGMLARTLPHGPHPPWTSLDFPARIHLCLFVHRIEGLPEGLYMLVRDGDRLDALRAACRRDFAWEEAGPDGIPLYRLLPGDWRRAAAEVSCHQDIAGDGAFSLGMVADFGRTLEEEGAWAYRRLFWESGLIGQALYLEAEAAGVRATGIGCYFDDTVHRLLDVDAADDGWQSLYHFTVGGAVDDDRLSTLPAYPDVP